MLVWSRGQMLPDHSYRFFHGRLDALLLFLLRARAQFFVLRVVDDPGGSMDVEEFLGDRRPGVRACPCRRCPGHQYQSEDARENPFPDLVVSSS